MRFSIVKEGDVWVYSIWVYTSWVYKEVTLGLTMAIFLMLWVEKEVVVVWVWDSKEWEVVRSVERVRLCKEIWTIGLRILIVDYLIKN